MCWIVAKPLVIPPVLLPLTTFTNSSTGETFDFYEITTKPLTQQIYPNLPATKLVGYNGLVPGPTIQTTEGKRTVVRFINQGSRPLSVQYVPPWFEININ